jgi:glycosyltransferase involved in cell wall biosynthesis
MTEAARPADGPHVLIDGYFLGKPYGFGRFIFELCRALGNQPGELVLTVAVPARVGAEHLPDAAGITWHRLPDANFILWEQVLIPRLARRLRCDVIHFPYNTRALSTRGMRSVTTVHDLLFLKHAAPRRNLKDFVHAKYARWVFSLGTRRSDAIVSVSRTTAAALARLGLPSTTIYNTVDGFLASGDPGMPPDGRPYLLHRGGYFAHRNTGRVIEAFRLARQALPEIELRIIGAPYGAETWRTQDDPAIRFLPRISDAALAGLYAHSLCVVAASLEEGFGLPVVEAFGFGTPVITSRVDPMMEIAGDAALLVDPTDVAEMAQAMIALATDPVRAASLVAKGRARLPLFASARVAEQMLEVYRTCGARNR